MCSAVVWIFLCSCPSATLPGSGPFWTLGHIPDPQILSQGSGTEQSTGSRPAAFPVLVHLPTATLPGELLHQERTHTVLAVLDFHQQHDVTAGDDLQGEGGGGSVHMPGFRGLGRGRTEVVIGTIYIGEVLCERSGCSLGPWEGAGAGLKLFCFQSCCMPQQELGEGTREQNTFRFSEKLWHLTLKRKCGEEEAANPPPVSLIPSPPLLGAASAPHHSLPTVSIHLSLLVADSSEIAPEAQTHCLKTGPDTRAPHTTEELKAQLPQSLLGFPVGESSSRKAQHSQGLSSAPGFIVL